MQQLVCFCLRYPSIAALHTAQNSREHLSRTNIRKFERYARSDTRNFALWIFDLVKNIFLNKKFVAALDGKIRNSFRPVNPLHKNRVYQ